MMGTGSKKKITQIPRYTTGHLSCSALSVSTGNLLEEKVVRIYFAFTYNFQLFFVIVYKYQPRFMGLI